MTSKITKSKLTKNPEDQGAEFIGFDLGHGESAVGRSYGRSTREPEILEYGGEKSFVTAVAQNKSKGKTDVRIGASAVNLAVVGGKGDQVWVKFKNQNVTTPSAQKPTALFTKTLFSDLAKDNKIQGLKSSRFIVGCPSGWSGEDRKSYGDVMRKSGLKHVRIVPESRAALMTAIEQGHLSLDAAKHSVLIVDIGSSTTDFTYCIDMRAEDVGHNVLGSGLLDGLLFERNLARQKHRKKIEKLLSHYPYYRPILEYWCRLAKEDYFNGVGENNSGAAVEMIRRLPVDGGILFEIRMDDEDAKAILSEPIKALNGFTWPETFAYALGETLSLLGDRAPQTVLLTGGASRLPLIGPACEKAFKDAKIVRGAEPEFAIARGLSWLGRFEHLYEQFQSNVEILVGDTGPIQPQARAAAQSLGATLAPVLVDALIEDCVMESFKAWRKGDIKTLDGIETDLNERVKIWLQSEASQTRLRPKIAHWFTGLQRKIETHSDQLCRDHGLPAMVLSLDDDAHIAKHLDQLSLNAPHVASLESDTALAGTTISAILVGVLLAKANLLAPLLTNPIGLAVGGAIGVGSFVFGKKALEGTIKSANIPVMARQLMTDNRIKKSIMSQRETLISHVASAWNDDVSRRFSDELLQTLKTALIKRASERAVLFLL